MSNSESHDETCDGVDVALMELIKSHQAAMRLGDFAVADGVGMAVLDRAMQAMIEAAERDEVPEDFLLQVEASECEERRDWDGALATYRKVLELAEHSFSSIAIWRAHDGLANLHYLLNDHEAALKEQRLATAAARDSDSCIGLRMALMAEATLLLRLERAAGAALRVHEGLAIPNDTEPIDALGSARLQVLQAECESCFGHVAEARRILHEVFPVVQRAEQMPGAAGYHSALCSWWWAESQCRAIEDDSAGEVHALEQSLAIARRIDEMPHCSGVYTKARVMRILSHLAQARWRNGNFGEARRVRQEGENIRVSLELPSSANRT